MKNALHHISDSELIQKTKTLVAEESRITAQVIECLEELDARKLYLTLSYPSLFEFATKELGYSEAAAYRRINAMRVVRELPELKPQIESGELKLSTLTQVKQFLNQEQKAGQSYSLQEKRDLIHSVSGLSSRDCERKLASLNPAAPLPEIRFTADESLIQDLKRLRELWAHVDPDMSYTDLIARMAKIALERVDPERRVVKASTPSTLKDNSASPLNRHIPAPTRRLVWKRDQGRCQYTDPQSGRSCQSRFALQLDHILPYSQNGTHDASNLRLLCGAHNRHRHFRRRKSSAA